MSAQPTIEQRLSALEQAIAEIQNRLGIGPESPNRVDRISGSMKDIPEDIYQEFLAACREFRNEGRPVDDLVEET
jgi:hypothetical protein